MIKKDLIKRALDISFELQLSHVGSVLTALPIIMEIYEHKKPDEKFVLSAGHAHLAHAVVMESLGIIKDAKQNIIDHGIHCERKGGCDVSTGSLGHGLGIATGMALSDRTKNVYCSISDGECAEGSIWEALNIRDKYNITNLKVHVNINGWGAYDKIDTIYSSMIRRFDECTVTVMFHVTYSSHYPIFLQGQLAHYKIMNEPEYKEALKCLE
ncbi:MAG: 1-deoxy-D-xylulose-5-phosphate synthase N-terminal domain-containing protein [Nitrosotalea sp.]